MYLFDGIEMSWEECMEAVVESLESGLPVSFAYHFGADCYWSESEHPWYAKPVQLTDEGVVVSGRLLEVMGVV